MSLIPLVDPNGLEGAPREMAESGFAQYGQYLQTWRAIMNKPELFASYLPFLRQVAGPGELDSVMKDLSALLVGTLNHCRYTASHRSTSARAKGVSDEDMQKVAQGDWDGFDPRTQIALRYTRELTLNPAVLSYSELPQAVLPETLRELSSNFDPVEILELTMSIAVWNALARFHRVMNFDLDMPEAPEGVTPQ